MSLFSFAFLLFLLVVMVLYFCLPAKVRWVVLLIASYVFYMASGWTFTIFLVLVTVATFLAGRWLSKLNHACTQTIQQLQPAEGQALSALKKETKARYTKKKRRVLALALIGIFGILFVIKYADFVIGNLNGLLELVKFDGQINFLNIALPLGISFFTFQSAGYLIDVYRGKVEADNNILKYALFVSYFPQIIQGPIGRYDKLAHQLYEPHSFDYTRVKFGMQRMLWGFFKKMVIADRVSVVVNDIFANYQTNHYTGFIIFLGALLYSIQIYADFSAGMDIVIGISESLGITLTENFRRPFIAKSVAEFWQRWHITLGAWMRDYLFYPLALSKPFNNMSKRLRKLGSNYAAKVLPTCLASFIVFVLIGLWHGASWKYVVYGLYQAFFVSTGTLFEPFYAKCRRFFRIKPERFSWRCFQVLRTIFIVTVGRYLSRAVSFMTAYRMYKATLAEWNPWVLFDGTLYKLGLDQKNFQFMILMIVFLFFIGFLQEKGIHLRERIARQGIVVRWTIYFAAIFGLIIFGMYGDGFETANFIYQGF